ncbi:MAG: hypothetical protein AVDCRST_MAG59-3220, partial [uncultured Thermomicrobiales bacterium]
WSWLVPWSWAHGPRRRAWVRRFITDKTLSRAWSVRPRRNDGSI